MIYTITAILFRLLPIQITCKLLQRLELAVYFYCRRMAEDQEDTNLKELLKRQAISEYQHAQLFAKARKASLEDITILWGKPNSLNHTLLLPRETNKEFIDGISLRYLSARYFFCGKSANSYPLHHRLAFMAALEGSQVKFYQKLSKWGNKTLRDIASKILLDEVDHSVSLTAYLLDNFFTSEPIEYWTRRLNKAIYLVPIDLIRSLYDS